MEEENSAELPFLDVIASRQVGELLMTSVHRKATNKIRIQKLESNHLASHKIGCMETMLKRIKTHCSSQAIKETEKKVVRRFLL